MFQKVRVIWWVQLIVIAGIYWAPSASASEFVGEDHLVANLLVSSSYTHRKVGAKVLYTSDSPNVELLDLAAYQLATRHQSLHPEEIDSNAWILKALSNSKSNRYDALVSEIYADSGQNKKLKRYIRKYLKTTKRASLAESYEVSKDAFDTLRTEIESSNAVTSFELSHINAVHIGDSIEVIYSKLGKPTSFTDATSTISVYGAGRINLQLIKVDYEGSGSIVLNSVGGRYEASEKVAWIGGRDLYSSVPEEVWIEKIKTSSGYELRQVANDLFASAQFEETILDAVVQRVWDSRLETSSTTLDALAWLLKYVGSSENPRYYSVIDKLLTSNPTSAKKIRRYAAKTLKKIPKNSEGVESFYISI